MGPEGCDLHEALGEREGLGGEQGRAGIGELLHARDEVRGLAYRGVVHVQVGADGAHDDLARVQAHADADGDAVLPAHALGVLRDRLLHPERRVAGAHGVVLVRQGGAEQRHDAVAHDLVHGAFVAVDGFHHAFKHRIEELPGLLGVAVGEELHGALEVSEEDRNLLALTLEGSLGREDLLGEVLGGVGLRGGRGGGASGHGLAALKAEPGASRQLCATGTAGQREAGSAAETEPGMGRVLLLAPGALHRLLPTRRARLRSADDSVGAGEGQQREERVQDAPRRLW